MDFSYHYHLTWPSYVFTDAQRTHKIQALKSTFSLEKKYFKEFPAPLLEVHFKMQRILKQIFFPFLLKKKYMCFLVLCMLKVRYYKRAAQYIKCVEKRVREFSNLLYITTITTSRIQHLRITSFCFLLKRYYIWAAMCET